jgi:hypothetical protein
MPRSTNHRLRPAQRRRVLRRHFLADEFDGFDDVREAGDRRGWSHSEHLQSRRLDARAQNPMQAAPRHDVGLAAKNFCRALLHIHQL